MLKIEASTLEQVVGGNFWQGAGPNRKQTLFSKTAETDYAACLREMTALGNQTLPDTRSAFQRLFGGGTDTNADKRSNYVVDLDQKVCNRLATTPSTN